MCTRRSGSPNARSERTRGGSRNTRVGARSSVRERLLHGVFGDGFDARERVEIAVVAETQEELDVRVSLHASGSDGTPPAFPHSGARADSRSNASQPVAGARVERVAAAARACAPFSLRAAPISSSRRPVPT